MLTPRKILRIQKFKPSKISITSIKTHCSRFFSSIPLQQIPTPPGTSQALHDPISSSQRHFIKHLSPSLTPSLIATVLPDFRSNPDHFINFIHHVDPQCLDINCYCLAITIVSQETSPKPALGLIKKVIASNIATRKEMFDGLVSARKGLSVESQRVFDLFLRAFCDLKMADEAFKWFLMMKCKRILPKIESCNDMLSLFLKLNRTPAAWVLYAEMFRLKIESTVCTFNIMINVLCKEGKLKKAMEFVMDMEGLGFKPNVVTYNTIVQGYCSNGNIEGAQRVIEVMKCKGVDPDSYTYNSIINGMCKIRRVEQASAFFDKMEESGLVPTAVTYNSLIDGYCNKGDLDRAFSYRDEMIRKGIAPTVSTYNVLIHSLFMEGLEMKGKRLTCMMR
ncbi:hypothetical protein ACET3Z_003386 [Daucus carota]